MNNGHFSIQKWVRISLFLVLVFSITGLQSCKEESLDGKDIYVYALAGRIDLVERLLDSGTDVNERDWLGSTAIFNSVKGCHLELTSLLIERGADISVVNNAGETPISHYVQYPIPNRMKEKALEIIKLLIDHGVDVELKTVHNRNASETAYESARLGDDLDICNKEIGDFIANYKKEN